MVETLLEKHADWLSGDGPDADVAQYSRVMLHRNLADFPFPAQCAQDERAAVEERVLGILEGLNLLADGQYWSLTDLDVRERGFLAERLLISRDLTDAEGPAGVYIADDQSLSIAVNDHDHLTICGLASGLQLQEVWSRISLIDDTLAGALDYAFDDRLGYLTSSIRHVGTGVKAEVALHLPGLVLGGFVSGVKETVKEKRHALETLLPGYKGAALGDLYALSNASTLGRSEDEIIFHLKHLATEIIESERDARATALADAPLQLEDRIGRALGVARGSRLLAFNEAISLLSSLRLGVSSGLLDQFTLDRINEVFLATQKAHIEMKCGHECDELTLSSERADLFRARLA